MGRSFNNNPETAKKALEGGGGEPVPEGEYIVRIDDVQDAAFANKGAHADRKKYPALNLKLKITETGTGTGEGRKVSAFRVPLFSEFASGKSAFEFFTFHKALGVDFSAEGEVDLPDNEEILGEEVGVYLTIGEPNAQGRSYNEVSRWFPASDGVKDTSAEAASNADNGDGLDTESGLTL